MSPSRAVRARGSWVALAAAIVVGAPGAARGQQLDATTAPAPAPTALAGDEAMRYPPTPARWKLGVAGGGMLAVGYGASAAMGAGFSDVPGSDMLFVPVAGPWIALGQSGCAPGEEDAEGDCTGMLALRGILYVIDGLVQLGGVGLVTESILMTTEAEPAAGEPRTAIAPVPLVTPGGAVGVGLVGTF